MWAEVHEHGVIFHAEYDAESVLVVCHLMVHFMATITRLPRAGQRAGQPLACTAVPTMTSGRVMSVVHCIQSGAAIEARRSYVA